ncbi:hypothetical protein BU24DRAFT_497177 [Aaosphaeria arxii CBS 175.79]|uniref:Uncharacterized protein n=1 Tax=Aaosphaeria arxii CBS 175.79 TaxID=1450172 RepID=A0A6A5X9E5_9PLEO|nr:uncharacterized protein BU24DRAFT_497177 [Aaosphaeria arxii CBS 175.79]KAF2009582.1 hypothetical protein BU24DRAFT_497177 [Aaosphaeria arxii CBS 175.79]
MASSGVLVGRQPTVPSRLRHEYQPEASVEDIIIPETQESAAVIDTAEDHDQMGSSMVPESPTTAAFLDKNSARSGTSALNVVEPIPWIQKPEVAKASRPNTFAFKPLPRSSAAKESFKDIEPVPPKRPMHADKLAGPLSVVQSVSDANSFTEPKSSKPHSITESSENLKPCPDIKVELGPVTEPCIEITGILDDVHRTEARGAEPTLEAIQVVIDTTTQSPETTKEVSPSHPKKDRQSYRELLSSADTNCTPLEPTVPGDKRLEHKRSRKERSKQRRRPAKGIPFRRSGTTVENTTHKGDTTVQKPGTALLSVECENMVNDKAEGLSRSNITADPRPDDAQSTSHLSEEDNHDVPRGSRGSPDTPHHQNGDTVELRAVQAGSDEPPSQSMNTSVELDSNSDPQKATTSDERSKLDVHDQFLHRVSSQASPGRIGKPKRNPISRSQIASSHPKKKHPFASLDGPQQSFLAYLSIHESTQQKVIDHQAKEIDALRVTVEAQAKSIDHQAMENNATRVTIKAQEKSIDHQAKEIDALQLTIKTQEKSIAALQEAKNTADAQKERRQRVLTKLRNLTEGMASDFRQLGIDNRQIVEQFLTVANEHTESILVRSHQLHELKDDYIKFILPYQTRMRFGLKECRNTLFRLISNLNHGKTQLVAGKEKYAQLEERVRTQLHTIQAGVGKEGRRLSEKLDKLQSSVETASCADTAKSLLEALDAFRTRPLLSLRDLQSAEGMLEKVHQSIHTKLDSLHVSGGDHVSAVENTRGLVKDSFEDLKNDLLDFNKIKTESQMLQQANEQLNHQLATQKGQCDKFGEEIIQLEKTKSEHEGHIQKLEATIASLNEQSGRENAASSETKLELERLYEKLGETEQAKEQTEANIKAQLEKLNKSHSRILEDREAEWANKVHRANQERDEKDRICQKTQDSLQRMRQEKHSLNTNLKSARDDKESMALKLSKVENDLDDMSRLAEEYSSRIKQIQSAGLEEKFEVERRGFLDRITTLEEKKSQLEEVNRTKLTELLAKYNTSFLGITSPQLRSRLTSLSLSEGLDMLERLLEAMQSASNPVTPNARSGIPSQTDSPVRNRSASCVPETQLFDTPPVSGAQNADEKSQTQEPSSSCSQLSSCSSDQLQEIFSQSQGIIHSPRSGNNHSTMARSYQQGISLHTERSDGQLAMRANTASRMVPRHPKASLQEDTTTKHRGSIMKSSSPINDPIPAHGHGLELKRKNPSDAEAQPRSKRNPPLKSVLPRTIGEASQKRQRNTPKTKGSNNSVSTPARRPKNPSSHYEMRFNEEL